MSPLSQRRPVDPVESAQEPQPVSEETPLIGEADLHPLFCMSTVAHEREELVLGIDALEKQIEELKRGP